MASANAFGPSSAQHCASRSCARSISTTFAPSSINARAHARPMPEAAPVMAATFPLMDSDMGNSLLDSGCGGALRAAMRDTRLAGERIHDHGNGQHGAGNHET